MDIKAEVCVSGKSVVRGDVKPGVKPMAEVDNAPMLQLNALGSSRGSGGVEDNRTAVGGDVGQCAVRGWKRCQLVPFYGDAVEGGHCLPHGAVVGKNYPHPGIRAHEGQPFLGVVAVQRHVAAAGLDDRQGIDEQ